MVNCFCLTQEPASSPNMDISQNQFQVKLDMSQPVRNDTDRLSVKLKSAFLATKWVDVFLFSWGLMMHYAREQ